MKVLVELTDERRLKFENVQCLTLHDRMLTIINNGMVNEFRLSELQTFRLQVERNEEQKGKVDSHRTKG